MYLNKKKLHILLTKNIFIEYFIDKFNIKICNYHFFFHICIG